VSDSSIERFAIYSDSELAGLRLSLSEGMTIGCCAYVLSSGPNSHGVASSHPRDCVRSSPARALVASRKPGIAPTISGRRPCPINRVRDLSSIYLPARRSASARASTSSSVSS
jgi:hypothetical protein